MCKRPLAFSLSYYLLRSLCPISRGSTQHGRTVPGIRMGMRRRGERPTASTIEGHSVHTRDRLSKQYRLRPGDAEHIPFLEFTHIPSYPLPLPVRSRPKVWRVPRVSPAVRRSVRLFVYWKRNYTTGVLKCDTSRFSPGATRGVARTSA